MEPKRTLRLIKMLCDGEDRQRRTPVSERNRQIAENHPGETAYRDSGRYGFYSQRRLNQIRHDTDVANSIRKRNY